MGDMSFFFAGGGTGGHIYPAVAVAERIAELDVGAKVHFFCSGREIDSQILGQSGLEYTRLAAKGFCVRPSKVLGFCSSFVRSYKIAKAAIAESKDAVVIGAGGFVAGPVCLAAHRLKVPIVLLNVDIVPGRANKIIGRWADEIFVQFEETREYFAKSKAKISVVGCPLRRGFGDVEPSRAVEQLGLDMGKKVLLVTGASSGAANVNDAVCSLLEKLDAFAGEWQIVHLAGRGHFEKVESRYAGAKIGHKILAYYDDMPGLLAAADLVIGRSGAVSVAEYAAASVPSICMPYPYHKDRHQYLNAGKLVEAGAAVIVDDLPDATDRAEWLWEELEELMRDEGKRQEMAENCAEIANVDAASKIAERLLEY
ncbi:MAG: UDP-N-acetylglucosamine--N-acetylmuramyl-(pentapeptide) pyrophosphoryl-undecaprenol N-acetylglucosamine transferase [Planctomycetes bacterium]|nr:UDP-N-acetylglucosamine--N-acetylmuramyl-(pentapeptide) pyrophosphoryl-undecaprenol N-acetylglucosamine transferase [Planctomycetota bacterium]